MVGVGLGSAHTTVTTGSVEGWHMIGRSRVRIVIGSNDRPLGWALAIISLV